MCIVFWTVSHPGYRLILASNRDEYLDRPATHAHWHTFGSVDVGQSGLEPQASSSSESAHGSSQQDTSEPWVMSGRDLGSPETGTWLGMTRDLRFGILLSVRQGFKRKPLNPPSRGGLVKSFLAPPTNSTTVHDQLAALRGQVEEYDGFNLLLFRLHPPSVPTAIAPSLAEDVKSGSKAKGGWGKPEIGYLSNHPSHTLIDIMSPTRVPTPISPATHDTGKPLQRKGTKVGICAGLSNSSFNQPWPKVSKGEVEMGETLREWSESQEGEEGLIKRMQELLSQSIPLTSLADVKNCTCLHPVKLGSDPDQPMGEGSGGRWYGTRVSTVVLVKDSGAVTFVEKDMFLLDDKGEPEEGKDERTFRWNVMQHAA